MSNVLFELAPNAGEPYFSWIVLYDHLFDVFCINRVNVFWASHLSVVFTVDFGEDVASIGCTSFDFAALFDLKTLYSAFYALHFRHMLTPLIDFLRGSADIKWDDIILSFSETDIKAYFVILSCNFVPIA